MRFAVLAAAVAVAVAGCTATGKGIRTIGAPAEAGGQTLKLEVRNVDLTRFTLSLAPQLLDGDGRPLAQATPAPATPARPAAIEPEDLGEIPTWLVDAADRGDRRAIAQLAAWTTEIQRRKHR